MTRTCRGVVAAGSVVATVGVCSLLAAPAPSIVPVLAQAPPASLRVCGDPDNLPYSNERLEGFENRIAAVVAGRSSAPRRVVCLVAAPARSGAETPSTRGTCDVIFGVPEGLDFVLWTKPYYRSSLRHGLPQRPGATTSGRWTRRSCSSFASASMSTRRPRRASRGVACSTTSRPTRCSSIRAAIRDRPRKLLDDLVAGTVDVAVAWGPAGRLRRQDVGRAARAGPAVRTSRGCRCPSTSRWASRRATRT